MGRIVETARVRRAAMALMAASSTTLAGCAANQHDTAHSDEAALLAQDGSDANEVETQTSTLTATFALVPTTATAPTLDDVVAAADDARAYFLPTGCLSVTKDPSQNQATYAFDACTGPWGLVRVTGTVVATYTMSATAAGTALRIDVVGNALHFNRATADYHATATITARGLAREMKWSGSLTGTTARGRAISRTSEWDTKWTIGQSCIALDGTATGDVMGRTLETTVRGYQRCRHECPQSGGDVTITDVKNARAVDVSFDGSDVAVVTTTGGTKYPITLACGL